MKLFFLCERKFVEHKEPATFTFESSLRLFPCCVLFNDSFTTAARNVCEEFEMQSGFLLLNSNKIDEFLKTFYIAIKSIRPTLAQPFNPNQQFPNQQFPNQPPLPIGGQVNGPFPLRQRSSELNDESINSPLIHFLKTMEMQFQDKQLQSGEKLDGSCEDRFFCEVALIGKQPTADALHQTLYHIALE